MPAIGNFSRQGLPRPIPATELQAIVGASQAFCSPDALNSTVTDSTARWPFLLSDPPFSNLLIPASRQKPTHQIREHYS
jgi:hypothetical protein